MPVPPMHGRTAYSFRAALAMAAAVLVLTIIPSPPASGQVGTEAAATGWRQLSAGSRSTCGIRAGRLYCWGDDGSGALGNGYPLANRGRPVEVAGGFTDWTTVSVGQRHGCAVRAVGRLYCWGGDGHGQLGTGAPFAGSARPVEVGGHRTDWRAVSAGSHHTCAVTTGHRLFCWGANTFGELGHSDTPSSEPAAEPVEVDGATTDWRSVSAGSTTTCGVRLTGQAFCWGSNYDGALGSGQADPEARSPVEVSGGADEWAVVTTDGAATCGVGTDAHLYCWGTDGHGQQGDGPTTAPNLTPVEVPGQAADWRSVQVGGTFVCATKVGGQLFCWGEGAAGQLGNGAFDAQFSPVEVVGAGNWRSVSTGTAHACGRRSGGRAFCWGFDGDNQLGNGPHIFRQPTPVPVG